MPNVPAYLKAIRPPRSSGESYRLLLEHGGAYVTGTILDACSSKRLTSLRDHLATKAGQLVSKPVPRDKIRVYQDLPASGLTYYREILREQAARCSPFSITLTRPFLGGPRDTFPSSVSIDVEGGPFSVVRRELVQAFNGVPTIGYYRIQRGTAYRPRIPIVHKVSNEVSRHLLHLLD